MVRFISRNEENNFYRLNNISKYNSVVDKKTIELYFIKPTCVCDPLSYKQEPKHRFGYFRVSEYSTKN